MTLPLLQIGHRTVTAPEIIPLLIRYQMLPQFCRELLIDQAIEGIECAPESIESARQEFYEQHQITDAADRQAWCIRLGLSEPQIDTLVSRSHRIEQFKHQT